MRFADWDFENDVISVNEKPLIPAEVDSAQRHMGSAYAVDTAQGIFFQEVTEGCHFNLICIDEGGKYICMEDIVVVASNMKYTAMIVHTVASGENYLLDTRGVFYLLDVQVADYLPAQFSFSLDRKTGFYSIGDRSTVRWMVRGLGKKKMFNTMMESGADSSVVLNSRFTSYLRKTPDRQCLFLTCPNTKKGKMLHAILNEGLEYEIVPNVFAPDITLNVCIPRSGINLEHAGFHFLDARYESTYAIQDVPIEVLIAILDLDKRTRDSVPVKYVKPSEKQFTSGLRVINTLKGLYEAYDDLEIYKKLFKKILLNLQKGTPVEYENQFESLRIPYPENPAYGSSQDVRQHNIQILADRFEYIMSTLELPEVERAASMNNVELYQLCVRAYKLAGEYRKKQLSEFEAQVMNSIE